MSRLQTVLLATALLTLPLVGCQTIADLLTQPIGPGPDGADPAPVTEVPIEKEVSFPIDTDGDGIDDAVITGTVSLPAPSPEGEHAATVGDALGTGLASAIGMVSGNPMLGGAFAQLSALLMGRLIRRKKDPPT